MPSFSLLPFDADPILDAIKDAQKREESFGTVINNLQLQQHRKIDVHEFAAKWKKSLKINNFKMNKLSFSHKSSSRIAWERMKKQLEELHESLNPTEEQLKAYKEMEEYWEQRKQKRNKQEQELIDALDAEIAQYKMNIQAIDGVLEENRKSFSNIDNSARRMSVAFEKKDDVDIHKALDEEQQYINKMHDQDMLKVSKDGQEQMMAIAEQQKLYTEQLQNSSMEQQQALHSQITQLEHQKAQVLNQTDQQLHTMKQDKGMDQIRAEMYRGNHYDAGKENPDVGGTLQSMQASSDSGMLVNQDSLDNPGSRQALDDFRENAKSVFKARQQALQEALFPKPKPEPTGNDNNSITDQQPTVPQGDPNDLNLQETKVNLTPEQQEAINNGNLPLPPVPDTDQVTNAGGTPEQVAQAQEMALDIANDHANLVKDQAAQSTAALNTDQQMESLTALDNISNPSLTDKQSDAVSSHCSDGMEALEEVRAETQQISDIANDVGDTTQGISHMQATRPEIVDSVGKAKKGSNDIQAHHDKGTSKMNDAQQHTQDASNVHSESLAKGLAGVSDGLQNANKLNSGVDSSLGQDGSGLSSSKSSLSSRPKLTPDMPGPGDLPT